MRVPDKPSGLPKHYNPQILHLAATTVQRTYRPMRDDIRLRVFASSEDILCLEP